MFACVCMCVSVCVYGKSCHELPHGIPWLLGYGLANSMMRDRWTGVPYYSVCMRTRFAKKGSFQNQEVELLHAKSKTRIACWNVRTLGTLGYQNAQLFAELRP